MLVAPYGTSSISSSGSELASGECGSAAIPRAPPAVPQAGMRLALALTPFTVRRVLIVLMMLMMLMVLMVLMVLKVIMVLKVLMVLKVHPLRLWTWP